MVEKLNFTLPFILSKKSTIKSKEIKNLYFVREIIYFDAIKSGYNLQAALSTRYNAGKLKNLYF